MTVSTFEIRLSIAAALLVGACRAGLPPEPPGADAADASAPARAYVPPANPYATSAFEGVKMDAGGGHEHMHHGGHGKPAAEKQPESTEAPR